MSRAGDVPRHGLDRKPLPNPASARDAVAQALSIPTAITAPDVAAGSSPA